MAVCHLTPCRSSRFDWPGAAPQMVPELHGALRSLSEIQESG